MGKKSKVAELPAAEMALNIASAPPPQCQRNLISMYR